MSDQAYVTMLEAVTVEKPSGGRITYSKGALQLIDVDLAATFIAEGKAAQYPPVETTKSEEA